mmetsp:Transcript_16222/g.32598  ORF Transcript_16222/g.32598 Transcript_16222/m.32598 type:complete len:104 (-) Transcript_16222:229-540(-)
MRHVLSSASTRRGKVQYMSAVWPQTPEQAKVARRVAAELGKQEVPLLAKTDWHDAEEYHRYLAAGSNLLLALPPAGLCWYSNSPEPRHGAEKYQEKATGGRRR